MKKLLEHSKIIVLFASSLFAMNLNAQDLKNHRWEDRILIIKTLDATNEQFLAQLAEFKNTNEEMKERRFVLYTILGDVYTQINYKNPKQLYTTDKTSGRLANILDDNKLFEVILIGLDGGIKLRQTKVLTKKELFDTVDSMPMRRSELRKKNE